MVKRVEVTRAAGDLPYMSPEHADIMTALIVEHRLHRALELGFHHGVSTCYIAAALDELGEGSLTTIDLEVARNLTPNVETLLEGLGLRHLVSVHYEPASYLWRLMKMLEVEPQPQFDLCYIDGAHSWATDGLGFFLADRLLAPGGWIVFDDLDWTFATSPGLKKTEMVAAMPLDERETAQVRKVYELLVKTHRSYDEFVERDGWVMARKSCAPVPEVMLAREIVHVPRHVGLGGLMIRIARMLARRW